MPEAQRRQGDGFSKSAPETFLAGLEVRVLIRLVSPSYSPLSPHLVQTFWLTSCPTLDPFTNTPHDKSLYLGGLILATETTISESDALLNSFTLPSLDEATLADVILPALGSGVCLGHVLAFVALETAPTRKPPLQDRSLIDLIEVSLTTKLVPVNTYILYSLPQAVVPIASMYPDPTIRHISFRILSSLIDGLDDESLKFSILVGLISHSPFPQMQSSAITLLRSVILSSLARATSSTSAPTIFSSPHVLEKVSQAMFRLEPQDIFDEYVPSRALNAENIEATREFINEFSESPQAVKIIEALNFYYVLLSRDQMNIVGL